MMITQMHLWGGDASSEDASSLLSLLTVTVDITDIKFKVQRRLRKAVLVPP